MRTSTDTSSVNSSGSSLRRSGARPRPTPVRVVGPVLALALAAGLTACGSDGGSATDPAGTAGASSPAGTSSESPSESPSRTPPAAPVAPATIPATGTAGVTEAVVVDATEGGGSPSTLAFALDGDRAVQDFVVGLQNGLPEKVASAVAEVERPDATPYGAVAATGCEPPRSVAVDAGEAGFEVVAQLPKSTVQCLAPVTYVVVFAAPDA
ncbi:hypothetical protein [Nocardioides xinjiangensis]|uniref:hypothetical protein n=1 Tax=Nocardioides xinjiangensis TaxID=2817376 RepID=UPI001B30CD6E|nr:hypothetical protein [Nocardioides sp. SYSU D00514]